MIYFYKYNFHNIFNNIFNLYIYIYTHEQLLNMIQITLIIKPI